MPQYGRVQIFRSRHALTSDVLHTYCILCFASCPSISYGKDIWTLQVAQELREIISSLVSCYAACWSFLTESQDIDCLTHRHTCTIARFQLESLYHENWDYICMYILLLLF